MTRAFTCCVAVILAGTLGCGGATPSVPTTATPVVDPASQGLLITWGLTGVYFLYSGQGTIPAYDNLVMLGNFIKRLGVGRAPLGSLRILYTTRRPQATITDPQNRGWYGPFLDVIGPLGTIDFGLPSRVDLSSYTVVVYDPCEILEPDSEGDLVRQYLIRGGRALVLGDNACWPASMPSAQFSNRLLSGLGITFTGGDPNKRDPLMIPIEQQTGVFEGVRQVSVFRVAPQVVSGNAVSLLKDGVNIVSAIATLNPQ
jgi:hypothetical protein